jgi:hypothetical protein
VKGLATFSEKGGLQFPPQNREMVDFVDVMGGVSQKHKLNEF